jgi:transketolase
MTTPLNERRIANAIRVLAMDAVQQANSGHPGAPMGMADIADVVWREFLNHNPTNPQWANRDRLYYRMVMAQCCNMRYCI